MTEKTLSDFVKAPNIGLNQATYELENEAILRNGVLDKRLEDVADWKDKVLLDVGCGTGFWLKNYAKTAAKVIGVEPDPTLLELAETRLENIENASALRGSAEHIPLGDASVDIVHARWAYFFGAGSDKGLAEVKRVLRPGGVFIAIDNSWRSGDFADLLDHSVAGNGTFDPELTQVWWTENNAKRIEISDAGWNAKSATELEKILRIEFPEATVDNFLSTHEGDSLSYAIALFVKQRNDW